MKSKILIKLTSLTVSFALCLSAMPKNFQGKAVGPQDSSTIENIIMNIVDKIEDSYNNVCNIVEEWWNPLPDSIVTEYDYKSIKDMFHNITYNKNPDEILANCDKRHKESNNFISKIVFPTGAVVIAAKLAWNLHKMHKENKNISKKEDKSKKHTDEKSFWTKVKNKLGIFKDKFLIFAALITLFTNLLICYLNDYFYSLKREKISKSLSKEKDRYFDKLEWLFKQTCEEPELINKIWWVNYGEGCEGEKISLFFNVFHKDIRKANYTEEEKAKFGNDLEEIRTEINKIFRENGMKELKVEDYIEQLKKFAEHINKNRHI